MSLAEILEAAHRVDHRAAEATEEFSRPPLPDDTPTIVLTNAMAAPFKWPAALEPRPVRRRRPRSHRRPSWLQTHGVDLVMYALPVLTAIAGFVLGRSM